MRGRFPIAFFVLAFAVTLAAVPVGAEPQAGDEASPPNFSVTPGEAAGEWLLETVPTESCSVSRARSGCEDSSGLFAALSGPGEDCCSRHFEICEAFCWCGIREFHCWPKSSGGCSSGCGCEICPP